MQFDQNNPYYLDGMQHYLSGNWEKAEKIFIDLNTKYPESTFIMLILGKVYYSIGRLDESIGYYRRILDINPKYYIAYFEILRNKSKESKIADYYLARLKLRNNRFDEAITILEGMAE